MALEQKKNGITIENEDEIKSYYEIRQQIDSFAENIRQVITHPTYCLPFMQPGRLLHIKHNDLDFGWGAVVNYNRTIDRSKPKDDPDHFYYVVDVLLCCTTDSSLSKDAQGRSVGIYPCDPMASGSSMIVVPVLLNTIQGISHIRLKLPNDIKGRDGRASVLRSIKEVRKRFGDKVPLLDPIQNMGITDPVFKKLVNVSKSKRPRGSDDDDILIHVPPLLKFGSIENCHLGETTHDASSCRI